LWVRFCAKVSVLFFCDLERTRVMTTTPSLTLLTVCEAELSQEALLTDGTPAINFIL
jgi:hypothetical protein